MAWSMEVLHPFILLQMHTQRFPEISIYKWRPRQTQEWGWVKQREFPKDVQTQLEARPAPRRKHGTRKSKSHARWDVNCQEGPRTIMHENESPTLGQRTFPTLTKNIEGMNALEQTRQRYSLFN